MPTLGRSHLVKLKGWMGMNLQLASLETGLLRHVGLQADGLDLDEALGVGGVEATSLVHGGDLRIVKGAGGGTAFDNDVALVQFD